MVRPGFDLSSCIEDERLLRAKNQFSTIEPKKLEQETKFVVLSVTIQLKATDPYFPVGPFILLYKEGSNCWVCGLNPKVWRFKWKLLSSTFAMALFVMLYKVVLSFESVDETWTTYSVLFLLPI